MINPFNNFSWVIDGFIAASEFPDNEQKLKFLKEQKIGSIVTLSEKKIDEELLKKYKIRNIHIPIKDFDVPTISDVKKFLKWMKLMEKWKIPTLIHCDAGIGRTGTMLSIFFMSKGKSPKESLDLVRSKRNYNLESLKQEKFIYEIYDILKNFNDSEEEIFSVFHKTVETLRKECPWDKKQTMESLLKYFEDEFQELKEAIKNKDIDNTIEELGDVLLEIMFLIVIGEEKKNFTVEDVLNRVIDKLVKRHPHVFKDEVINSAEEVEDRWEELKKNSI
ncbi:MAG: MazG nucleotide pyrophosphohydrolase domain-containing protein [Caldisericia bacterium]